MPEREQPLVVEFEQKGELFRAVWNRQRQEYDVLRAGRGRDPEMQSIGAAASLTEAAALVDGEAARLASLLRLWLVGPGKAGATAVVPFEVEPKGLRPERLELPAGERGDFGTIEEARASLPAGAERMVSDYGDRGVELWYSIEQAGPGRGRGA